MNNSRKKHNLLWPQKEVGQMTVEERILSIQIMEMIKNDPKYAQFIGVEAKNIVKGEKLND